MANTNLSGPVVVPGGFVGPVTGSVNGVTFVQMAGAPTDENYPTNTIVLDTTNSDLYINAGTLAVPSYMKFTRATE